MYETIQSPIRFGRIELKNRIIFAPTTFGVSQEEYIEKIRKIAAGGCAMIIIGDVPVCKGGFGISLYTKKGFAFYQTLAETVHTYHCKICAQLHQSDSDWKAMVRCVPGVLLKRISMDDLRIKLQEAVSPYITNMPLKKVRKITKSFGTAAKLAQQAGFDMVQVHGDRMCGSFASAVYNHRQDAYGGTLKIRACFLLEAVSAVRKAIPEISIDVKLPIRMGQYGKAGFLQEDLSVILPLLERAGADSFHVTLANHDDLENTIPPANHVAFGQEGCFLPFCDAVKQYTKKPVCGVGGLTQPDFVEQQLKSGRIDCAAMSRQLLADSDWPKKVMAGEVNQIRHCVRCNRECLGGLQRHTGTHCIYEKGAKSV